MYFVGYECCIHIAMIIARSIKMLTEKLRYIYWVIQISRATITLINHCYYSIGFSTFWTTILKFIRRKILREYSSKMESENTEIRKSIVFRIRNFPFGGIHVILLYFYYYITAKIFSCIMLCNNKLFWDFHGIRFLAANSIIFCTRRPVRVLQDLSSINRNQ